MIPNPRPARIGTRAVWCREYSRCLNQAITAEWPGFSCDRCELVAVALPGDPDPAFAIQALCFAVCHPRPWARYVERLERLLKPGDDGL